MQRDKLARLLPILRCPRTGAALRLEGETLVSETGEIYPIINGKPILVRSIRPLHITPPAANIVSQNIGEYTLDHRSGLLDGPKVHLGSGNVPCRHPDVISIDILPNENVDMVAEAEYLPFADGSLAYLESGAVFEHLYDPLAAAKEVRRALMPGGQMYIDTAFMQGYHGFPCHYFNMTPQAVETFIVDDFELISSSVPMDAGAPSSVEALLRKFIEALPRDERTRLLSMRAVDLLDTLGNTEERRRLHGMTSEHIQRSLGASSCVVARKPEQVGADDAAFREVKQDYYAARVGVMQRHHELQFYRGRALESQPKASGPAMPSLALLLEEAKPRDMASIDAWRAAIVTLERDDVRLTEARDEWIRQYLSGPQLPDPVRNDSARIEQLERELAEARATRDSVLASSSWKITAPLRRVLTALRGNVKAHG